MTIKVMYGGRYRQVPPPFLFFIAAKRYDSRCRFIGLPMSMR